MAKKQATKDEREYMGRVAELGCIICGCPASVHHIREGQGISQRASNYLVVPLCYEHHQGALSIHNAKRQFEGLFGDELKLLSRTIEQLHKKR